MYSQAHIYVKVGFNLKKWFLLAAITLLLAACSGKNDTVKEEDPAAGDGGTTSGETSDGDLPEEDPAEDPAGGTTEDLSAYFLDDGTIAHFKGDGIEFSNYQTRTEWLDDRHVNVYEDNGGVELIRSFRLDDNKIVVLQERPSEGEDDKVTLEDLSDAKPVETYLAFPLEVGNEIDGWKVISVDENLETPLQKFTDVIVLEETFDDGAYNRSYFAKGFGEIKRHYFSEEEDGPFEVTSVIEQIE